jgi:hypothetical protein
MASDTIFPLTGVLGNKLNIVRWFRTIRVDRCFVFRKKSIFIPTCTFFSQREVWEKTINSSGIQTLIILCSIGFPPGKSSPCFFLNSLYYQVFFLFFVPFTHGRSHRFKSCIAHHLFLIICRLFLRFP